MIVPIRLGITPERIISAHGENHKLSTTAIEQLKQVGALHIDLHVSEDGRVTGGHVIDTAQPTEAAAPKTKTPVTIETVIAAVIQTRDVEIADLKKKIAELEAVQDKRKEWLSLQLNKTGADSFKKNGVGTIFYTNKTSVKVKDREAFLAWVFGNNKQDFITNAVSKDQVLHMLEEEKQLPPGVEYTSFKELSVRKA